MIQQLMADNAMRFLRLASTPWDGAAQVAQGQDGRRDGIRADGSSMPVMRRGEWA